MNDPQFDACRSFLESKINDASEIQVKFLEAYIELIKLKSAHDTQTNKAVIEKEIKLAEAQERRETAGIQAQAEVNKNFDTQSFGLQATANTNWNNTQQNWQNNQASMHAANSNLNGVVVGHMAANGYLAPRSGYSPT